MHMRVLCSHVRSSYLCDFWVLTVISHCLFIYSLILSAFGSWAMARAEDWLGLKMIIVPDDPGSEVMSETLEAKVQKVFDGDGFLSRVWNPLRGEWVERVPFRFAFLDAPEMGQPLGSSWCACLHEHMSGQDLHLSPLCKQSMG